MGTSLGILIFFFFFELRTHCGVETSNYSSRPKFYLGLKREWSIIAHDRAKIYAVEIHSGTQQFLAVKVHQGSQKRVLVQ